MHRRKLLDRGGRDKIATSIRGKLCNRYRRAIRTQSNAADVPRCFRLSAMISARLLSTLPKKKISCRREDQGQVSPFRRVYVTEPEIKRGFARASATDLPSWKAAHVRFEAFACNGSFLSSRVKRFAETLLERISPSRDVETLPSLPFVKAKCTSFGDPFGAISSRTVYQVNTRKTTSERDYRGIVRGSRR